MGSTGTGPEVILYDYQFAPNAQKARTLLNMAGIPYTYVEQPFFKPRTILQDLGIEYRRVPVNAIGKDFYCDNRTFLEAVQEIFPEQALPTSASDHAYEAFGYRTFWIELALVPAELNDSKLQGDRNELFAVFSRTDFAELRPSALAEFKSVLDIVENEFLCGPGPWLEGKQKCGVADIHASWMIKWALETLDVGGKEKGFSKKEWPKTYKWCEGMPKHDEAHDAKKLSAEEAKKRIVAGGFAAKDIGVDENDPTGLKKGEKVSVETNDDAKPGNTKQYGKLVGLGRREIVIELDNGIRVHFPRIGFVIRKA